MNILLNSKNFLVTLPYGDVDIFFLRLATHFLLTLHMIINDWLSSLPFRFCGQNDNDDNVPIALSMLHYPTPLSVFPYISEDSCYWYDFFYFLNSLRDDKTSLMMITFMDMIGHLKEKNKENITLAFWLVHAKKYVLVG